MSQTASALSVPTLTRPLEDAKGYISSSERAEIETLIREMKDQDLMQMSVLVIPSLEGENLEEYSIKVAETWKLGSANKDDGLLLLLAMEDRKMKIEVGNGIEGEITDAYSRRVIAEMVPFMKRKEYGQAVLMVVKKMKEKMEFNLPKNVEDRRLLDEERREKQELADKQRKEEMKEFFGWIAMVGAAVLSIMGVYFFIVSFNSKEIKKVKKQMMDQATINENARKKMEAKHAQLESMKIDYEKVNYLRKADSVESIKKLKRTKQDGLAEMKSYLGVK